MTSYPCLRIRIDSHRKKLMQDLVYSWATHTYYSYRDPAHPKRTMYYALLDHYDISQGAKAEAKAATFRGGGFTSVKVISTAL